MGILKTFLCYHRDRKKCLSDGGGMQHYAPFPTQCGPHVQKCVGRGYFAKGTIRYHFVFFQKKSAAVLLSCLVALTGNENLTLLGRIM